MEIDGEASSDLGTAGFFPEYGLRARRVSELWVIRPWAGQAIPSAHYASRDGISGGPRGTVSLKATRRNARVAFCFPIIYDCSSAKLRTLFVLREQSGAEISLLKVGRGCSMREPLLDVAGPRDRDGRTVLPTQARVGFSSSSTGVQNAGPFLLRGRDHVLRGLRGLSQGTQRNPECKEHMMAAGRLAEKFEPELYCGGQRPRLARSHAGLRYTSESPARGKQGFLMGMSVWGTTHP